jgi:hypothetical protein
VLKNLTTSTFSHTPYGITFMFLENFIMLKIVYKHRMVRRYHQILNKGFIFILIWGQSQTASLAKPHFPESG